jgi:hypothetical protein
VSGTVLGARDIAMNKTAKKKPGTMAHAYNPSFSGDTNHEDRSSKPGWTNSL